MKDKKIKCAIVGLGRIGSTLEFDKKREKPASHAGVITSHNDCILTAGSDIDPEKCVKFQKDWNCVHSYVLFSEMLNNEEIDILHIATPPSTHKQMLYEAIKKNIPVIILEKPVSDNLKDAVKMNNYAVKSSSKVLINHERRYSLQYQRVKKVITEEVYGKLLSIKTKMYMGRTRRLIDMIFDDGTHIIDLVNYLCGSCVKVNSVRGAEKKGFAIINCSSDDVCIDMEFARGRNYLLFELDFSFEKGRIISGNGYYNEFESMESPYYENFRSLVKTDISFSKSEYFLQMFNDAVKCFKEKDHFPVSGISDGVNSIRIINKIAKKI